MTTMEILGALLVASHILTVTLIILWFGLDKPKNFAAFRQRFRQAFFPSRSRATISKH